jgi:hypothetical protein
MNTMDIEKLSDENEIRVKNFLESFDLKVKKIDGKKSEVEKPDYEVELKDGFYFLCEVKSLFSDSNEPQLHKTYLNKIQRKIIKANDQFETMINIILFQMYYASYLMILELIIELSVVI